MEKCTNHRDNRALSICHSCGKYFCAECLTEGEEYYYCSNPACQELFKNELPDYLIPDTVICPNCKSELELEDEVNQTPLGLLTMLLI